MDNKEFYVEMMNKLQTSFGGLRKLEKALGNVVLDCDLTEFIDQADKISAYILGLKDPCDAYYEYFWNFVIESKCVITEDIHTYVIHSWAEFYDYWTKGKEKNNE